MAVSYAAAVGIESDIEGALGSQDSEPSVGSEYEVTSTSLMSAYEAKTAESRTPAPRPSGSTNWVVYVAVAGLVLSLLAAAAMAFGGVVLSGLALLFS